MNEIPSTVSRGGKKRRDLSISGLPIDSADLVVQARELAWTGQHSQAIKLAAQALDLLSQAGEMEEAQESLDLLDTRAESYIALGKLDLAAQDIAAMVKLANAEHRPELKALALNRKAFLQMRLGDLKGAVKTATTATQTKHTSPILRATSLFRLGEAQFRTGNNEAAIQTAEQAISLFQSAGDKSGTGRAYWVMSVAYFYLGRVEESRHAAQSALEICQGSGDWYGTGNALIGYSNTDVDFAERIQHLQQALQAFDAAGYRERKTVILVNLGLAYYELGLYHHARRLQSEAVETSRAMGAKVSLAYGLINLVEAELKTNALDMVQAQLDELTAITPGLNDPIHNAALAILFGDLALTEGNPSSAIQHYQTAVQIAHLAGLGNENIFLTKLSQAYLAEGSDPTAALQATTEATNLHRNQAFAKPDGFTTQEIWWCHALALSANRKTRESHEALERAYDLLLESITSLRDEGLRRNYLNKVNVNRKIITAWI
jgi:tetratricopeptide (TPR) repeat protein